MFRNIVHIDKRKAVVVVLAAAVIFFRISSNTQRLHVRERAQCIGMCVTNHLLIVSVGFAISQRNNAVCASSSEPNKCVSCKRRSESE